MYWYIPVITVLIVCAVFVVKIKRTYKIMALTSAILFFKSPKVDYQSSLIVIESFQDNYYPKSLKFLESFSNITAYLVLNSFLFAIFGFITHLTDSVLVFQIYATIYGTMSLLSYVTRLKAYKNVSNEINIEKCINKTSKTVYTLNFVFSIYIVVMGYMVYAFNGKSKANYFSENIYTVVLYLVIQIAVLAILFVSINNIPKEKRTKEQYKSNPSAPPITKVEHKSSKPSTNVANLKTAVAVLSISLVVLSAGFLCVLFEQNNQITEYEARIDTFEEKVEELEQSSKANALNNYKKDDFYIMCYEIGCVIPTSSYYHTPLCEDMKGHTTSYTVGNMSTLRTKGYNPCPKCYHKGIPIMSESK